MRRLKKDLNRVFDESSYTDDLSKRGEYLENMKAAINSPFGVALVKCLDDIEAQAFNSLYKSTFKHKITQAKAEIRIASYMKGIISGYTFENESFKQAMEKFNQMEYGE